MKGIKADLHPSQKLFILTLLIIASSLITFSLIGIIAISIFGGSALSNTALLTNIPFLKTFQIVQSMGIFIIPSALATYIFFKKPYLDMKGMKLATPIPILASVGIIIISQAFINWSGYINHQLQLPESWTFLESWITNKEQQAMEITQIFIETTTVPGFLVNVFMIAILPAIGEEWLFRGLIQRYLGEWISKPHLAIFITSVLFSAMHLQFLSFLPRFILGMVLGYLFYWGKNMWLPITAHFTNNFLALLLFHYYKFTSPDANPLEVDTTAIPIELALLSFAGMIGILIFIKMISPREKIKS
ncbi:CPBP family intramembrane metalloprotease [Marinilabiliaceae bacterium JC017]|nr:CPBP family intramembrane metalloprotease [Marinilabiliaceae bacterium JC017]